MYAYLKAESIKLRRTSIRLLAGILPIITMALAYGLANTYVVVDSFNWWYVMLNPFLITLLAVLIVARDANLKERAVKSLPNHLRRIWYAKIVHGSCYLMFSSLIIGLGSMLLQELYCGVEGFLSIAVIRMFFASLIIGLLSAWQIAWCMLWYRRIGFFPTLLMNVILNLAIGTSLATSDIWMFFPHCYIARTMIPILQILPNGLLAVEGNMTYSKELMNWSCVPIAIVVSILLLFLFSWFGARSFEQSEAR